MILYFKQKNVIGHLYKHWTRTIYTLYTKLHTPTKILTHFRQTCQLLTFSTPLNPLRDISSPQSLNSLHFHLFSKIYEFSTSQQITHIPLHHRQACQRHVGVGVKKYIEMLSRCCVYECKCWRKTVALHTVIVPVHDNKQACFCLISVFLSFLAAPMLSVILRLGD